MDQLQGVRMLADLPSPGDRDELFDWAVRGQPFRDGGIATADFESMLAAAAWVHVTETSAFWHGDPVRLLQATAACVAGLVHVGCPWAVVIRGGTEGLSMVVGAPHLPVLRAALEAHWPGVVLRPVARPVTQGGGACSVWMRHTAPAPGRTGGIDGGGRDQSVVPPSTPIERLAEVPPDRPFQLELLLRPVPTDVLRDRAAELALMSGALRNVAQHQVQLEAHVSAVVEDRTSSVLADEVDTVAARVQHMLAAGGVLLSGRLVTWSADDLAVVAGSLVGHAGSRTVWGVHPRSSPSLPATLLCADDAADAVSPPRHDVHGLPSRRSVRLDEHPDPPAGAPSGATVALGTTRRGAPVRIGLTELCSHLLVTGASGSGKSTAVAALLVQLQQAGVPFTVVEPVKREWATWGLEGLGVWCPGSAHDRTGWVLNPLEVPTGVEVGTHLDQLVALFRGVYALPDPLPHLLELALVRAYEGAGCDLTSDRRSDHDRWPTLSSVLSIAADLPAELGYEPQIRANLRAAIQARLGGLVRGARGRVLDQDEPFPVADALRGSLVLNLDAIGDDHARSLVMALFVLRLAEERRTSPSRELRHVTVLEEAHRLLPAQPPGSAEPGTSGAVAHGASTVADLIAEVRSSGEGVVVVDQSASAIVRSALVNTSTKLALRTVDRTDQMALGAAMGVTDEELATFASLRDHEAVVATAASDRPLVVTSSWVPLDAVDRSRGRQEQPAPPATFTHLPDPVRRAAEVVVRAPVELLDASDADPRAALLAAVRTAAPDSTDEDAASLVRSAVDRVLAPVDSARRWPRDRRASAAVAAVVGSPRSDHPAELLLDGRLPRLSCVAVCPDGGCSTGELVAGSVDGLLADPVVVDRMLVDPEERRRRTRREAEHLLGDGAPDELVDHTIRCLTACVFDEVVDLHTVRSLVGGSDGG